MKKQLLTFFCVLSLVSATQAEVTIPKKVQEQTVSEYMQDLGEEAYYYLLVFLAKCKTLIGMQEK